MWEEALTQGAFLLPWRINTKDIIMEEMASELRIEFEAGTTRPREWRVQQLKNALKMMKEQERVIQNAVQEDIGKHPFETFTNEIYLVRSFAELAVKHLSNWMAPVKASTPIQSIPCSAKMVAEPYGVVLIISSWNFPFLLCMDPVLGAISAGNTVVLKPSELAPATSKLLANLIPKYMDKRAIRVVEGGASEATALLHQKWDKILFTGSQKIGKIVMAAAAQHLTPVLLELGGKNPLFIDCTANIKVAARRIASGKWGANNGQACVAPDYVLAEKSVAESLITNLKDMLKEFYGEDPQKSNNVSRIINSAHFSRLSSYLAEAGVHSKIVHGGHLDPMHNYISPTILLDVPLNATMMKEEIFGPLLPIIVVSNVDEAISIMNSYPKPLTMYGFTKNSSTKDKLITKTSAGSIMFNDTIVHFAMPGIPLGGVGFSGMGCYHGKHSFEAFSHRKPVIYRSFFGDVTARYPPYSSFRENVIRHVLGNDFVGALLALIGIKKTTFDYYT